VEKENNITEKGMLVNRAQNPKGSVIELTTEREGTPAIRIGGEELVIMAGPCAVENYDQLQKTAGIVQTAGASILRGGAYKPRTSPYSFLGLGEEGLKLLDQVRAETGLFIVTEVMDARHLEHITGVADILQVGSRNMQNFTLLTEVGKTNKPVLLKRGMMATIQEFLYAAEYIMKEGNKQVILCERGIRTFNDSSRNTLDLGAIPILKRNTHLPVIIDPSHGTGISWMVPAMSKAAVAAGADGLLIEVHHNPDDALSDGGQSLHPDEFRKLMQDLDAIASAVGRSLAPLHSEIQQHP
jgi:3-deoxy-7-phosphoheptulonate synthase